MQKRPLRLRVVTGWGHYLLPILALVGCAATHSSPVIQPTVIATPTISSLFQKPTPQPTLSLSTLVQPTSVTTTSTPFDSAPTRTNVDDQVGYISLYADDLNINWNTQQSSNVRYNLESNTFVHSGKTAIAITPTADYGSFFLTVKKDAQQTYPRARTLGLRFWLGSGGNTTIGTSDLAVTVTGSNQYNYWVANDTSVKGTLAETVDTPIFSETRLYFLQINRAIPPNSWVEVVLWLDDRVYDPDYKNVTGIYIKNDQGFLSTFYIDDLQLIVIEP